MMGKYMKSTTNKRFAEMNQQDSIEQTQTLSFHTARDSHVLVNNTFRQGESGLKNASIAGIVSTPRLGVVSKSVTQGERAQINHGESGKAKTNRYAAIKTPDKTKASKTMKTKSSRESLNIKTAKNLKLSNEKTSRPATKTSKTPQKHAPKSTVPVAKLSLNLSKE